MIDAIWIRILAGLQRLNREERGDSLVNWIVLAVGLTISLPFIARLRRRRTHPDARG